MTTVRFAGTPTVHYVSEGEGYLEHQIVLSEPSTEVVTVTIQGPSYRAGDMEITTQTITFQPGQTTATWRVAITDDTTYEGDEVFSFTITGATNAVVDMSTEGGVNVRTLLGWIVDNDPAPLPTVRFQGAPSVHYVSEGAGYVEHQIVLSAASSQVVTVEVQGPSYRAGDMDIATQTITFQPGQTTAAWRVAITEDTAYEGDEVFGYTIIGATNAVVDMSAVGGLDVRTLLGWIVDNDSPPLPSVRFEGAPSVHYVSEGAGYVEHRVVLSQASAQVVTIEVQGPSYRVGDMAVTTQTITFQPGQTTATWRVAITEDTEYEGDEVFGYTITSATNATIDMSTEGGADVRTLLGWIVDNDPPVLPAADEPPPPGVVYQPPGESVAVEGSAGSDTITATSGSNRLRGNGGHDEMSGGRDFDDIHGNMGNDTASGGLGDDWVVGGKDNDLLFGDEGADIVYGNLGNDTCDGGADADLIRGGQGDDVVRGQDGDDWLSGDRGDDTVTGGAGADIFHTFGNAGIDRVLDFSVAQGDRVMLDPGTVYTVSQVGADTVIAMNGGGQMILVGVQMSTLPSDWIFGPHV